MLLYIWSVEKTCNMTGGNRMKVLIVGAGGQGGSCASILARQDNIEEIRIVDLKEETAKAIREGIFALMTPVIISVEGLCVATIK